MQFEIAACTDVGTRKHVNQDGLHVSVAQTKLGEVTLAVVCDGVGGLAYGEVASSKAVYAFKRWFETVFPKMIDEGISIDAVKEEWKQLINHINEEILKLSKDTSSQMGTTLTAILFLQGQYLTIQIGDSRIYEICSGQLKQITTDQTLVEREVQAGHITREQAQTDPRKHVLLQCIGLNEIVEPQFEQGVQQEKANYLLCTDGFYNSLSVQELYDNCYISGTGKELETQLKRIIEMCKYKGERDNISAILFHTV